MIATVWLVFLDVHPLLQESLLGLLILSDEQAFLAEPVGDIRLSLLVALFEELFSLLEQLGVDFVGQDCPVAFSIDVGWVDWLLFQE